MLHAYVLQAFLKDSRMHLVPSMPYILLWGLLISVIDQQYILQALCGQRAYNHLKKEFPKQGSMIFSLLKISIRSGNFIKMDGKLHVCNMILDPLCVLSCYQKDSAVTFFLGKSMLSYPSKSLSWQENSTDYIVLIQYFSL